MIVERSQHKTLAGVLTLLGVVVVAAVLSQAVLQGTTALLIPLAAAGGAAVLLMTLMDWRRGVLFFLSWMLFEDLVRKYLGNNMAIYFAKDALAAACCLSFYVARRGERKLTWKAPFLFPLVCFFFWALIESFNPNSPSIWYGLLGMKLYFGYVPLMFLGYALLRDEADLRQFLVVNAALAAVIALVGVTQGVTGVNFLTPTELAPDIAALGGLMRSAPITHERFLRPPSVFVSDGRFGAYLLMAWLLNFGATVYCFLKRLPARKWFAVALGLLTAGIIISAVRSALAWVVISMLVFFRVSARDLWGASARPRRLVAAVVTMGGLGVVAYFVLSTFYPEALGARLDFYQQTMLPSSSSFELSVRLWDYPVAEFLKAFDYPHWFGGYGTGTSSLGTQYVTRILGAAPAGIGVESGFGNLILEMGVPGLVLWLAWTGSLMWAEWKVVRQLRGTALFPLAFMIFWFSFITLLPGMLGGLAIENFVTASYLFLLAGVQFSLPTLAKERPMLQQPRARLSLRTPGPARGPLEPSLPPVGLIE